MLTHVLTQVAECQRTYANKSEHKARPKPLFPRLLVFATFRARSSQFVPSGPQQTPLGAS